MLCLLTTGIHRLKDWMRPGVELDVVVKGRISVFLPGIESRLSHL
jgi:hypothetical protein